VDGHINAKVVAQPASFIAETAGFSIPDNTKFFIVPETGYGPDFPFSGEKMSVTLALYKAANLNDAVDLTVKIQRTSGGSGHSCGIYTQDDASVLSELLECFFLSSLLAKFVSRPSHLHFDLDAFYNVTFRVYISLLDVITPFTYHSFRALVFVSNPPPPLTHTLSASRSWPLRTLRKPAGFW